MDGSDEKYCAPKKEDSNDENDDDNDNDSEEEETDDNDFSGNTVWHCFLSFVTYFAL